MSIRERIERNAPENEASPTENLGLGLNRDTTRQRQVPTLSRDTLSPLKSRIVKKIIAELTPDTDTVEPEQLEGTVNELFDRFLAEEETVLGKQDRQRLHEQVMSEIMGFGPLESYLRD